MTPSKASPPTRGPVFILGSPKAGTTLLLSLLDGHPDLLVMPSELNYFRYSNHSSRLGFRKICHAKRPVETIEALLEGLFFLQMQDPKRRTRLAAAIQIDSPHDFSALDPVRFEQVALESPAVNSHPAAFRRLFCALLAATGQPSSEIERKVWVEKSPLQEEFATLLARWFPNARFLHLIRNPYANLYALREIATGNHLMDQRSGFPDLHSSIRQLQASYRLAESNRKKLPCVYQLLEFERLVSRPQAVIKEICSFLSISRHPCLLQPTLLERPWAGNSTSKKRFNGIDRSPLVNWRSRITALELALVNRYFGPILERYAYTVVRPSLASALSRANGESWPTYGSNRLLLLGLRSTRHRVAPD